MYENRTEEFARQNNFTEGERQQLMNKMRLYVLGQTLCLIPAILLAIFVVMAQLIEITKTVRIIVATVLALILAVCVALFIVAFVKLRRFTNEVLRQHSQAQSDKTDKM